MSKPVTIHGRKINPPLPNGVYQLEFEAVEARKESSTVVDAIVSVVGGPLSGHKISEKLRFTRASFNVHERADCAKTRHYARVLGFDEGESDAEMFLFRPFIADVVDGVIVSAGISSLYPLPAACTQPRALYGNAHGYEFEPLELRAA